MFKKPLNDLKTSAPLRSSDRRKLKQRLIQAFQISDPADGDLLVPDGLLSAKFSTHLDEPGTVYLAPDGDPIWFTIGKGSDDLIPTVYTLWKRPSLLPHLSTPAGVLPVLLKGADLMVPGVVQCAPTLLERQLVSIVQYDAHKRYPPFAVGHMALNSDNMTEGTKGKAVFVSHTWKDALWQMGSKCEPPDAVAIEHLESESKPDLNDQNGSQEIVEKQTVTTASFPSERNTDDDLDSLASQPWTSLSPQEVSSILRMALIQSIQSTISHLPPSGFPIPATTMYTTYILPSRPCYLPTHPNLSTPIDIKHSSHKSLSAFLRLAEKEGLLKLKDMKGDVVVMAVYPKHADVVAHRSYKTLREEDMKREKMEEREEQERGKVKEIRIIQKWKPHQQSVQFFKEASKETSTLYTLQEIKAIFNDYVTVKNLVNPFEQQYINIDEILLSCFSSSKTNETIEFLKRDDAIQRLLDRMQHWYEMEADGKDSIVKKGELKPVSVVVKIRQGRKASTLITNFEPFFLTAEFLADELRRICASATSVSPTPGKTAGMEVLVQGKQIKAVMELLVSRGVPKKWIETADLSDKRK